jgi:5-methylcytosine-specific restriction endonuclease McrA
MSSLRLSLEEYRLLVRQVLGRDGWRCRSCRSRNSLHCHHIIFRSQQGPDEAWNLVTLCSSCHDGVHKDVKDGQYGLVISTDMLGSVLFKRRAGWRPK